MSVQTLYTAATGMQSLESKLDVIANNLANVGTVGFKRDRANFEDLLYQTEIAPGGEDAAGNQSPTGVYYGLGSRVSSVQTNFEQGSFQNTGKQLDLAIAGEGFFQVTDPSGEIYYSRAGNFNVNANGQLVIGSARTGRLLEPQITIPTDATNITVGANGTVTYQQPGSAAQQQAGQINLAIFPNPDGLLKLGENLYRETDASSSPTIDAPGQQGLGTIQQGMLEASNVQPVEELIELIKTQRAFEMNSQTVQAGDSMMQTVANLRRFG